MDTIQLLLIDDQAMFREGLIRCLGGRPGLRIAGEFSSGAEALAALAHSGATEILLGVNANAERALEFVSAARRRGFLGQILVLAAAVSEQEAVQLVQAGVSGILHKQHSTEVLWNTIVQVANGEVCLEKQYLGPLFRSVDRSRPTIRPKLKERDCIVLRFILQGMSNREIAARLEVSEGAIKASLRQVFTRLGVHTRAQLVKVAMEQYRDQL